MKTLIIILIGTLIFVSCTDDTPDVRGYYLDDTFFIRAGERILIIDSADNKIFNLVFPVDSIDDYRCPLENCHLMDGIFKADITLEWIEANSNTSYIPLSILAGELDNTTCNDLYLNRRDTLGYRFCFLGLDPHPDTTNIPINKRDYIAKLKIERNKFEIYPNPTIGVITISGENIESIAIVNLLGEVIIQIDEPKDQYIIDLSPYNKGVYLIKVVTSDEILHKRIILK